jgi:putative SOS response-associated peptidase YedK
MRASTPASAPAKLGLAVRGEIEDRLGERAMIGVAPHQIARGLFGGVCERWKDPASGETIRSFTIITCAPNALCAGVNNRMPVILDPANYPRWLGETPATGAELQLLLAPFPAERMQAHEIGPAIGNVRNDEPALIERVS